MSWNGPDASLLVTGTDEDSRLDQTLNAKQKGMRGRGDVVTCHSGSRTRYHERQVDTSVDAKPTVGALNQYGVRCATLTLWSPGQRDERERELR